MRGPGEQYGADRAVEGGWGTHRQSLVVCPLRRCTVLFSNSFILIERAFEKKKKNISGIKYSFQLHKECREIKVVCKGKNSHV